MVYITRRGNFGSHCHALFILNFFSSRNLGPGAPNPCSVRSSPPSPDPHLQPWINPMSHGFAPTFKLRCLCHRRCGRASAFLPGLI